MWESKSSNHSPSPRTSSLRYGCFPQPFLSAHTFLDQRTPKISQLNSLVNSTLPSSQKRFSVLVFILNMLYMLYTVIVQRDTERCQELRRHIQVFLFSQEFSPTNHTGRISFCLSYANEISLSPTP